MARRTAAVALLACALLVPSQARADGDPASDYLLVQSIFLPFNTQATARVQQLSEVVGRANRARFRIKVALIAHPYDLGTAYSLMGKPQQYAQFLGQELAFVYRNRLLIVMPNGYGYTVRGRPDPRAGRVLARLDPPGKPASRLAAAAAVAVQRLAAQDGVHITIPPVQAKGNSASSDRIKIVAVAATVFVLAAAFVLYRRLRAKTAKSGTREARLDD